MISVSIDYLDERLVNLDRSVDMAFLADDYPASCVNDKTRLEMQRLLTEALLNRNDDRVILGPLTVMSGFLSIHCESRYSAVWAAHQVLSRCWNSTADCKIIARPLNDVRVAPTFSLWIPECHSFAEAQKIIGDSSAGTIKTSEWRLTKEYEDGQGLQNRTKGRRFLFLAGDNLVRIAGDNTQFRATYGVYGSQARLRVITRGGTNCSSSMSKSMSNMQKLLPNTNPFKVASKQKKPEDMIRSDRHKPSWKSTTTSMKSTANASTTMMTREILPEILPRSLVEAPTTGSRIGFAASNSTRTSLWSNLNLIHSTTSTSRFKPSMQSPKSINLKSFLNKIFLSQRQASPSQHCYSPGLKIKYELKGNLEFLFVHFVSVLELTSIPHIYFQIQADYLLTTLPPYHPIIKLTPPTILLNTSSLPTLFLSNSPFLLMRCHSALSEWFLLLPHLKRQTQKKPFRRIAN